MHTTNNELAYGFEIDLKAELPVASQDPDPSRSARLAIERRFRRHEAALALAYSKELDTLRQPGQPLNLDAFEEVMTRGDREVISIRAAQMWAKLDAADFRRVVGEEHRNEVAGYWIGAACARSPRYALALKEIAPDVAAAALTARTIRNAGFLTAKPNKIALADRILGDCETLANEAASRGDAMRLKALKTRIEKIVAVATGDICEHANALLLKVKRLINEVQVPHAATDHLCHGLPGATDYDLRVAEDTVSGAHYRELDLVGA
jgi:hypothetical protein